MRHRARRILAAVRARPLVGLWAAVLSAGVAVVGVALRLEAVRADHERQAAGHRATAAALDWEVGRMHGDSRAAFEQRFTRGRPLVGETRRLDRPVSDPPPGRLMFDTGTFLPGILGFGDPRPTSFRAVVPGTAIHPAADGWEVRVHFIDDRLRGARAIGPPRVAYAGPSKAWWVAQRVTHLAAGVGVVAAVVCLGAVLRHPAWRRPLASVGALGLLLAGLATVGTREREAVAVVRRPDVIGTWAGGVGLMGLLAVLPRRRPRPGPPRCRACGYDLTGNVSGVCPECGTYTAAGLVDRWQDRAAAIEYAHEEEATPGAETRTGDGGGGEGGGEGDGDGDGGDGANGDGKGDGEELNRGAGDHDGDDDVVVGSAPSSVHDLQPPAVPCSTATAAAAAAAAAATAALAGAGAACYRPGMNDPRPAADASPAEETGDVDAAGGPAEPHDATEPPAAAGPTFACPGCGRAVAAGPAADEALLTCPACGAEFFAATEPTDEDRDLAERLEADRRRREQELNNVRIRQVLTERRSLFRTRSYFVVLAGVAAVAAAQLGIFAIQRLRADGFGPRVAAYLAAVAGLLYAAWSCGGRVRLYTRELARPALAEPTGAPDFSTLSDGSQRVAEAAANLARLSGRE